jgi:HSP20 family molecular chaperone IbpA
VDATFRNGVLNVKLPRAEELKPRKIKVKSS